MKVSIASLPGEAAATVTFCRTLLESLNRQKVTYRHRLLVPDRCRWRCHACQRLETTVFPVLPARRSDRQPAAAGPGPLRSEPASRAAGTHDPVLRCCTIRSAPLFVAGPFTALAGRKPAAGSLSCRLVDPA